MDNKEKMETQAKDQDLVFPQRLKQPAVYTTAVGKAYVNAILLSLDTRKGILALKEYKIKECIVSWGAIIRPLDWGFDIVVIPFQVTLKLAVKGWMQKADKYGIKEPPTWFDQDVHLGIDNSIGDLEIDAKKFDPLGEGIAPKEVEVKQFKTGPIKVNLKF